MMVTVNAKLPVLAFLLCPTRPNWTLTQRVPNPLYDDCPDELGIDSNRFVDECVIMVQSG